MKRQIFVIAFLYALIFVSCERGRNYERTIWVNSDVECCGVKDPLNNLEWLRETSKFDDYNEAPASDYNFIFLFRNEETQKDHIVVNRYNHFSWVFIYDCEGVFIDGGSYFIQEQTKFVKTKLKNDSPEPCDTCGEFFQTHILVDTIAYSKVKS